MQEHRDADAYGEPLDGSHVRLLGSRQRTQEQMRLHLLASHRSGRHRGEIAEIVAGRERIALGIEQHDAHGRIASRAPVRRPWRRTSRS